MADHITDLTRQEQFVSEEMAQQIETLTSRLSDWVNHEAPTLETIEQQVLHASKDLAATLLTGLLPLTVPTTRLPTITCSCSTMARLLHQCPATGTTLLGPTTLTQPY